VSSDHTRKRKEAYQKRFRFSMDLVENLQEQGLNPVTEFFKTLALVDDPAIKAKLLLDVFEYVYPKRRAIEGTVDVNVGSTELSHAEIKQVLANDPFLLAAPAAKDPLDVE